MRFVNLLYSAMRGRSRERGDLRIEFGDFFQFLTNFAFPYRSKTIRNGFPMKFRIDIGRERSRKHFLSTKTHENSWKIIKSTLRSRQPPATYYRDSHCKIWSRNGKFWPIFSRQKLSHTQSAPNDQKIELLID